MSDVPKGLSVRQELHGVIYKIDPDEAPLVAVGARLGARQVMDELAREDPSFAAGLRQHRREMKAWERERKRLADEVAHLQIPFVVAALNEPEPVRDAAGVVYQISNYLLNHDAPAELIRDLLRIGHLALRP